MLWQIGSTEEAEAQLRQGVEFARAQSLGSSELCDLLTMHAAVLCDQGRVPEAEAIAQEVEGLLQRLDSCFFGFLHRFIVIDAEWGNQRVMEKFERITCAHMCRAFSDAYSQERFSVWLRIRR